MTEEFVKAIKSDLFANNGNKKSIIVRELSSEVNGGSEKKLREELVELCEDKKVLKNMSIIFATIGIYNAYQWRKDSATSAFPHWDERNKASQEFSFMNEEIFFKMFSSNAGFTFPTKETLEYKCFERDLEMTKELRLSSFFRELEYYECDHHTLQQCIMRVLCRTFEQLNIEREVMETACLPYI